MLQTAFGASYMNRASVFEWHKRFKEDRESVRGDMRCGGVRKPIHQSWLAKGLGLGLLCWAFKEIRKRFRRKRPALFKSDQWYFHQDNAPVHNSILVTDYLTKMGIETVPHRPYSPDLAPCYFCYSLNSEAVVMRQLRRWKRLWQRSLTRSYKRSSIGPSRSCWSCKTSALQLEEITSKRTRVSCVYSR